MPNYDYTITNKTAGDAFDVVRRIGGVSNPTDAYFTVMPWTAADDETVPLFQKHITTTPSDTEGVLDEIVNNTVTAAGIQPAGSATIAVDALPVTIEADAVLEFSGGAFVVVTEQALQGTTSISCNPTDTEIADNETATYPTCKVRFKVKEAQSSLLIPRKEHPYDIQLITSAGDQVTVEDGTINPRPQRTQ